MMFVHANPTVYGEGLRSSSGRQLPSAALSPHHRRLDIADLGDDEEEEEAEAADATFVQANPAAPLERTPYVPPEGAEPPRTGLTIIARGAPASDVALAITSLLRAFPAPADANSVRVCP